MFPPYPKIVKLLKKRRRGKIYFGFLYDCGEQLWLLYPNQLDTKQSHGFFVIKIQMICEKCRVSAVSYSYGLRDGIYCLACDERRDNPNVTGL